MARTGVAKTTRLLLRRTRKEAVERCMSTKLASRVDDQPAEPHNHRESINKGYASSSNWVPHPRTGIYFPEGQDRVMDGVPDSAASFDQSYWLRNVDGVDMPGPLDSKFIKLVGINYV